MRFLGRWVADCLELTFMLAGALLFMQIPAVTHAYVVALQQVAQESRRDIDQRETNARDYYHLPPNADDDAVIAALRPKEPSNAAALQESVARATMFAATAAQIAVASPLSRPITAALDASRQPDPDKLAVLQTCLETYEPQVTLGLAAVIYGIAGLLIGGLLGHTISAVLGLLAPSRRPRRTV
ncbi:MAG TPA: DUF2937 family protein [Acetobacteraceae bacterium]|jgi:hypothetical protein|nr:DUF2937 family protein [Acetobacteraceae bacterium]